MKQVLCLKKEAIEAQALAFCRQAGLFLHGAGARPLRAAAAVSGGADSMALLRLLLALRHELGIELTACHVNHGLRGAAADRDEAFVRTECGKLGVELRVFRAAELGPVPAHPGEEWARRLRYRCFESLRGEGIDRVATAHTVTDQAETLLFRLARGTGLHGAAGIRPARGFFVRPLLGLTRAQTEAYCRAVGQSWVTDETNLTDAYARNRLRSGALPALRSANAAAEENLARFCEKAARADAYFARQAERLLESAADPARRPASLPGGARRTLAQGGQVWAAEPLREADPLILEAAMHKLAALVRDPEEKYIRLLCALVRRGSGAVQLSGRASARAGQGAFWLEETDPPAENRAPAPGAGLPFDPARREEYPLDGEYRLRARLFGPGFQEKTQVVHKKDLKNQADYARIAMLHPAAVVRSRKPGDFFRPAGRNLRKSLRKWMNEAAVPPQERDRLPLLADGSEILWVCGGGFAEGLAPDGDSRVILLLEAEKERKFES